MKIKFFAILISLFSLFLLTACNTTSNSDYLKENSTDVLQEHADVVLNVEANYAGCKRVLLSLYEDGKYEFFTVYETIKPPCEDMGVPFTKSIKGSYDYDVTKIINSSINLDTDMVSVEETLYYLDDGNDNHYAITKENKYLNELLKQINVDLRQCAVPIYI